MIVQSNVQPEPIWVRHIDGQNAVVRLRKNIIEVEQESQDDETQSDDVIYRYDETEITLVNRANLTSYINENFDALFQIGIEIEQRPVPETDSEKIERLEQENLNLSLALAEIFESLHGGA